MKSTKRVKKRAAPKPKSKPVKKRAVLKPKSKPAAPASREKCDELVNQLGRAVLGDAGLQPKGWTHLVLQVRYYSETHYRIGGWCYLASDDFEPVAPDAEAVAHSFTALRAEMAKVDRKKHWKACLLRLVRASSKIDMDFEYTNIERWDPGREHLAFLKAVLGLAT